MAQTSEAPAESVATSTPTNQGQAGDGQQRRIVKAMTPKAHGDGTDLESAFAYPSPTADGLKNDEEDKKEKKKDRGVEEPEKWRNERLKTTEQRGKALREKELQARREANTVNETASSSANPFSKFLSAFSIDSHPKRKNETTYEDDEEPKKRLKPSESSDLGDGGGGNLPDSLFSSNFFWISAALVAAVGVAFAVHRGRN